MTAHHSVIRGLASFSLLQSWSPLDLLRRDPINGQLAGRAGVGVYERVYDGTIGSLPATIGTGRSAISVHALRVPRAS
jgi:hypothetical protein